MGLAPTLFPGFRCQASASSPATVSKRGDALSEVVFF